MKQYLLGYDLGSSSVKVSILDVDTGMLAASAFSPEQEMAIYTPQVGWAEQDPEQWWNHAVTATHKALKQLPDAAKAIKAIGISYQMHGLVIVDRLKQVLRPSIIWCDSRATEIGNNAERTLGEDYCRYNLLNAPGNFSASKLRWVRENESECYKQIYKIMLPGDYLAMRLSGEISTTVSGLSEGIFWDFQKKSISKELLRHFEIDEVLLPDIVPTFGIQAKLSNEAAATLGLPYGIEICYRAGDQPNNAFSLNALHPGEVAATAGTSGVIYGVVDKPTADRLSRVNTFVHVSHSEKQQRYGVLLCVNGTGIMNSWLRRIFESGDYRELNEMARNTPIGAEGLYVIPFGNGGERMFRSKNIGASFHGLNLNQHTRSHMSRAVQEGIVFSLGYGFEILRDLEVKPTVIRVGHANMFLSDIFCEAFANVTNAKLELYNTDGSQGAARGAGVGKGIYTTMQDAFEGLKCIQEFTPEPDLQDQYRDAFIEWKKILNQQLQIKEP